MGFLGDVRDVIQVVQKADNVELYQELLDIQAQAQELYEEKLQLQEDLREARNEIERLEKRFEIEGKLVAEGNVYYVEEDGERDGPFCTRCWDVDGDLVRLSKLQHGLIRCDNCRIKKGED